MKAVFYKKNGCILKLTYEEVIWLNKHMESTHLYPGKLIYMNDFGLKYSTGGQKCKIKVTENTNRLVPV